VKRAAWARAAKSGEGPGPGPQDVPQPGAPPGLAPPAARGSSPAQSHLAGAYLARPSLVRRLVILAAAWSLAVLAAAGIALSVFFSHAAISRFDDDLSKKVYDLVAGAGVDAGRLVAPAFTLLQPGRAFNGSYWEITTAEAASADEPAQGRMLRSGSLFDRVLDLPPSVLAALARSPGEMVFYDAEGPLKQRLRVAAMQIRIDEIDAPVIVMAAENRAPIDHDVRTFETTIALALVLVGAGLIAAVIVQVRVGLQPLFDLRREVAQVRTGQRERVTGKYPGELEPLAEELNALMAHTQEMVERQRTHVGNLAHALKTPLSVLITEARQQGGPLSEVVIRQAQAMGQHVDHHLRRARAAARTQGQGERTQVAPVVEDLSRTLEKIFRTKLAEIEWDSPEGLHFLGERQDLMEIAGNVMENACKWSRARVRVTAAAQSPREFSLTVEDDGPGLPPERRGEVLRRGARLDERTPGSGLGLAIVDELVRAYGGSLMLETSAWGGLKVTILLPRADA
jgi:signal transduction histidine kinase